MATTTTTAPFTTNSTNNTNIVGVLVGSTTGMVLNTAITINGFYFLVNLINSGTSLTLRGVNAPTTFTFPTGSLVVFGTTAVSIVCGANALTAASACFGPQCLGPDDREAIQLIAMVYELAATGGTNYITNFSQLLADASSWSILNEDQRRQIVTYITVVNAINSGAALSLNMSSLRTAAACALCLPWEQKKNIELFLKCNLNALREPD